MKNRFGVDHVDKITEAGPIKLLAENNNPEKIESIRHRVEISVVKHGSKIVAIVGHDDCAGNPVEKEIQKKQISKSIDLARGWGFDAEYLGLFVNAKWEVEEI